MKLIPAPHEISLCEGHIDLSDFNPETLKFTAPSHVTVSKAAIEDPRAEYHEISLSEQALIFRWNSPLGKRRLIERMREIIAVAGADKVPPLYLKDYADITVRGSIEGFYGIPWSTEDRKRVISFSGQNRLNQYIYAPKDDEYHNKRWRDLYDEEGAADMKSLIELSRKEGVDFVWSIHPGMAKFDFDRYDEELKLLIDKYEQLYGLGVRSFQLCMDDIDRAEALRDTEMHMRLLDDLADWVKEKGDVAPLKFVPPWYCSSWCKEDGLPYMEALAKADVEIMWTGDIVVTGVDPESYRYFRELMGKKPSIWFNYPVNDYCSSCLLMNEFVLHAPADDSFDSLVANPMNQAEASLISLSQISDYLWHPAAYNPDDSFRKALALLEENAEGLRAVARYTGYVPADKGTTFPERLEIHPELEEAIREEGEGSSEKLKAQLQKDLEAVRSYREKHSNQRLYQEIEPWVRALEARIHAALLLLEAKEATVKTLKGDVAVSIGERQLTPLLRSLLPKEV